MRNKKTSGTVTLRVYVVEILDKERGLNCIRRDGIDMKIKIKNLI